MISGYSLEYRSERAMNYSKAAGEATFRVGPLVKLARREPDDLAPYRCYFRTALNFNSTECAITFPNKYLKQNPPSGDVLVYKYLEQEARQLHDLQHHEMLEELPAALMQTKHLTLMKHVLSGWLVDLTHLIPVFFGVFWLVQLHNRNVNFLRRLGSI
jgi:hypothetical protein